MTGERFDLGCKNNISLSIGSYRSPYLSNLSPSLYTPSLSLSICLSLSLSLSLSPSLSLGVCVSVSDKANLVDVVEYMKACKHVCLPGCWPDDW